MAEVYSSMVHMNANMVAAVDLETTGRRAGYHEIIQIAIVPLDSEFKPNPLAEPFIRYIAPKYKNRQERQSGFVHGLSLDDLILSAPSSEQVEKYLMEWFEKLDLPFKKAIIPLAHNWAFESAFLKAWLGVDRVDELFHFHPRDSMVTAIAANDRAAFRGEKVPFEAVGLKPLCKHFKIINENPHDALSDCLAEAEVYRGLMHMEQF